MTDLPYLLPPCLWLRGSPAGAAVLALVVFGVVEVWRRSWLWTGEL